MRDWLSWPGTGKWDSTLKKRLRGWASGQTLQTMGRLMPNDPLLVDHPDGRHPEVLAVNGERPDRATVVLVTERLGVRPLFCNAMQIEATNQT
jgi:hypothetical protein